MFTFSSHLFMFRPIRTLVFHEARLVELSEGFVLLNERRKPSGLLGDN